jgi:hypothetical protein
MPSCSTSPDVYTRGFTGLNGTPLPGPTNRAVLLANMANDSRTSLIRDAVGGAAAPMWLVADKQGGFDAVPYVKSTVAGGLVTLPAYGVALVFIDDDAGCGNCSAIAPAPDPSGHNNTHTPVHPDPSSGSVVLQLLEPTDWLQFENGLGSTCTPDDPTACPQYNPQCDCTTPHQQHAAADAMGALSGLAYRSSVRLPRPSGQCRVGAATLTSLGSRYPFGTSAGVIPGPHWGQTSLSSSLQLARNSLARW